jgi:hypothetical protein
MRPSKFQDSLNDFRRRSPDLTVSAMPIAGCASLTAEFLKARPQPLDGPQRHAEVSGDVLRIGLPLEPLKKSSCERGQESPRA